MSSFRKAVFLPFTVVVNGLATFVATQSLQFGTVSANSAVFFDSDILFSRSYLCRNYCCSDFFLFFFPKWRFLLFLGSETSQFEFLKFQNIRTS